MSTMSIFPLFFSSLVDSHRKEVSERSANAQPAKEDWWNLHEYGEKVDDRIYNQAGGFEGSTYAVRNSLKYNMHHCELFIYV